MTRRRVLAIAMLGSLGPLAAIAPDASAAEASAAEAPAAEVQVTIDNFSFTPPVLTVAAGTRVTWTNRDDIPHTVTDAAEPRAMKSAPLDTGDSFAFTFEAPGAYRYFCILHPHMQGTVVVQ